MGSNFTAKAYWVFMFLLPLIFSSAIADGGLLPRQLYVSGFTLLMSGLFWKTSLQRENAVRIDAPTLLLVIFVLIATVLSFANALVLSETFYTLSKWWLVTCLLLVTVSLLKRKAISDQQLIASVIIFGLVAAGTAAADLAHKTLSGKPLLQWVYTVSGTFGNKNLLSSILFLCLPFFVIGLAQKRLLRISSGVALMLTLFILLVVRSRVVLIATAMFFAIFVLFYWKTFLKNRLRRVFTITAMVALGLGGLILGRGNVHFSTDVSRYFDRIVNTRTLQERLNFWRNSFEIIREHPMGVGLGNWQIYFPKYGLDRFDLTTIVNGVDTVQRPHNDFLWILCETGIIGFAAFAAFFATVVYQSFKLIRFAHAGEKWTSVCLSAGLVGFGLIATFDFPMERIAHLVVFVLLSALVIHRYALKFSSVCGMSVQNKYLLLCLLLGSGFSFAVACCRFAAEKQVYRMYAARTEGNSDLVLSCSEAAQGVFYQIDSKTIPLEWYKGVAQFSRREYNESEACFENALALTPYNIHVINNLASCYEVNGKRNDAIKMYRKALHISARFDEARLNLAAVYFNDKAYDEAFATIDSCSMDTKDPKYRLFLPPIVYAKADHILKNSDLGSAPKNIRVEALDYLQIYYESKQNKVTFEEQIIKHLKK